MCSESLRGIQPPTIDSEELEKAAQEGGAVLVTRLVDYANAVVALRFRQNARAQEFIKKHL
jgi:hypothetical protein